MPVDLSKVNISLQQFQDISSGKYNAGEVKLASATRLDKMNHHVRQRFRNDEMISHQEVIAIKEALVEALSQHGVDPEEIGKVRRELGLAPDGAADRQLHARSIKPLSRQLIRRILDRNASTINSFRGADGDLMHIVASKQPGDPKTEAERAEKRDAVNARLSSPDRAVCVHRGITAFQAIVAGDVDYKDRETRLEMRRIARELLEKALEPGDGDDPVTATLRLPSGQVVSAPTGMDRAAFIRHLEDIIVRLDDSPATDKEMEVRKHYDGLSPEGRRAFLSTLPDDPKGGFKARVVATMILHRRGFSDCETLSVPNSVSDANAIALAQYLADHPGLRGEALLRDSFFAQMKTARSPKPIPGFKCAFLPATTPLAFHKYVKIHLTNETGRALPGHAALVADTMKTVRERLGLAGLPEDTQPHNAALSGVLDDVVDRMTGNNTVRLTRETLREAYLEAALETVARRIVLGAVEKEIEALHGNKSDMAVVRNALVTRFPDYHRGLMEAKSPAEAERINARFRGAIRDIVATLGEARAAHAAVADRVHRGFAARLGIPPETVVAGRINLTQASKSADRLLDSILNGKAGVSGKAAIEKAFGDLADAFVAERVRRFEETDALDLPQATKDAIKVQLLGVDKVKDIDLGFLFDEAKKIDTTALETLLRDGAPKDRVYAEMEALNRKIEIPVRARLARAGKEVGPDDVNPLRSVMTTMLAGLRPGLGGLVAGFFAKPEVKKGLDDGQDYGMLGKTGSFNILSTDPQTHLDGDLALETFRIQNFFVAPRNAAAGH